MCGDHGFRISFHFLVIECIETFGVLQITRDGESDRKRLGDLFVFTTGRFQLYKTLLLFVPLLHQPCLKIYLVITYYVKVVK